MEAIKNESVYLEGNQKNSSILDICLSFGGTQEKFIDQSNNPKGFSKSPMRRISTISENITSLFKQNQDKLRLYFNTDFLISESLKSENLQSLEIYSSLSDGVYILIQGCVKIISFPEENPLPKASIQEFITSYFRKFRTSKETGLKLKEFKNQQIKKNSTNEKTQSYYNCGTLDKPFMVFQSIYQNCCCFSNQTIIYRLDENQKKNFKYFQNRQKLRQLIHQNRTFFKTNFMLFHTFLYNKLNFRSQFKVNNVALIKKGTLRVYAEQKKKEKDTQLKSHNLKQPICELCEPSLLVNGFTYEVSSCQSEIIFIENNDSFEFFKNPQWILRFNQMMAEKIERNSLRNKKFQRKSCHNHSKRHIANINQNESVFHNFMAVHQNNKSKIHNFLEKFNVDKMLGQVLNQPKGHQKSFSEIQTTSNTIQNQKARLSPYEKQKNNEILKIISPYVLISHKMGLKEITKTKSILNEKNQNFSLLKTSQPLKLTKLSINHLNKYQTQCLEHIKLPKYNMKNVPYGRRSLLRFEKFLPDKNQRTNHKKLKLNNQNLLKIHRKQSGELTEIGCTNFILVQRIKNLSISTYLLKLKKSKKLIGVKRIEKTDQFQ